MYSDTWPIDQCDTCRYWKHSLYEYGTCRRFPPVADHVQLKFIVEMGYSDENSAGDSIGWWTQPKTQSDDWCGEFSRIPD